MNCVSCLTQRFRTLLPKINTEKKGITNEIEILKRNSNNRMVWLLIDDLDATFQKTELERFRIEYYFFSGNYLPPTKSAILISCLS